MSVPRQVLALLLTIYVCQSSAQVYNSERKVRLGEEPWHVSLDVYYGEERSKKPITSTICSGILLDDRWVLTAAHCIGEHLKQGYSTFKIQSVYVGVGFVENCAGNEGIEAAHWFRHPGYQKKEISDSGFDIGLIYLNKPVKFCPYVQPALDLLASKHHNLMTGTECQVSGWGLHDRSCTASEVLRSGRVRVLDEKVCRQRWRENISEKFGVENLSRDFFERNICAGNNQGVGPAAGQGDSGSALVCADPTKRGSKFIYGVSSTTIDQEGDCCGKNSKCRGGPETPMIYTKVAHFREWIEKEMKDKKARRGCVATKTSGFVMGVFVGITAVYFL